MNVNRNPFPHKFKNGQGKYCKLRSYELRRTDITISILKKRNNQSPPKTGAPDSGKCIIPIEFL
ncbi:hypothetical protein NITGR_340002 [Nitrospina gracilis 3/211]|uniref:Uncharacterized protein n=1 Tax=Nitrospina gracilis (strain 3/211) TaxID=1266370 RepID=M1YJM5_NITG3|nr:hypothetical protein NITGR_340002 [Nitrospina gracilis 3/211]